MSTLVVTLDVVVVTGAELLVVRLVVENHLYVPTRESPGSPCTVTQGSQFLWPRAGALRRQRAMEMAKTAIASC